MVEKVEQSNHENDPVHTMFLLVTGTLVKTSNGSKHTHNSLTTAVKKSAGHIMNVHCNSASWESIDKASSKYMPGSTQARA